MENKFIDGLFANKPYENAPDWVRARLSFKPMRFILWLARQIDPRLEEEIALLLPKYAPKEWINMDVKVRQDGKWYCAINDYKPEGKEDPLKQARAIYENTTMSTEQEIPLESIPF